jgi:hypothetical protein
MDQPSTYYLKKYYAKSIYVCLLRDFSSSNIFRICIATNDAEDYYVNIMRMLNTLKQKNKMVDYITSFLYQTSSYYVPITRTSTVDFRANVNARPKSVILAFISWSSRMLLQHIKWS